MSRIYQHEVEDYEAKQRLLSEALTPVTPREFYDDVFPDEDLERPGHPDDGKPNMIIAVQHHYTDRQTGKRKVGMSNTVVFSGKEALALADKAPFALCGLCTYSGKRRTAKNAYKLYGFCFDLDGVGEEECRTVIFAISQKLLPCPQYIVNSGHGLHLYYLFEQPIPLYPAVRDHLQRLKIALTRVIWTNDTSYIQSTPSKDMRDYLGIYQNFRMPGSCSKIGKGDEKEKYLVTAYRWNTYPGERVTLSYLNEFVHPSFRVPTDPDYSSWEYEHLTLQQAKEIYPEWYQKRIVEGRPRGQWRANRKLYEWWLKRIQTWIPNDPTPDYNSGARDGTRYHCICVLFVYAIKCGVPYEDVLQDALSLVELFDRLTEKPNNHFTEQDVYDAAEFYDARYAYYSINAIELKTHIHIPRRPAPRYTREEALAIATTIRDIRYKNGSWRNKEGRPKGSGTKAQIVREWREQHPSGRKADCIRDTGLSKPTVLKWWDDGGTM